MRVLYLTNGFPWPLTSGYLRHYYLLQEVSRDHAVTLLSRVSPSFREESRAALEPFTERILTFTSTTKGRSLPRKVLDRLRGSFEVEPAVRDMQAAVERIALLGG